MGLAPTGVWRVPPPIPHCNWRTLPSSQSPSLPALSLPLPPTTLGSFCNAPGVRDGAAQSGVGGGVLGGWRGRALQRYLGPDPHLGVLDSTNFNQFGQFSSIGIGSRNTKRGVLTVRTPNLAASPSISLGSPWDRTQKKLS